MSSRPTNQFTEVAGLYDDLMSVVPYAVWMDYVRRLWDHWDFRPRRVLDLACGTGNMLQELLRCGYDVEGADASEAMLEIARRKLPPAIRLWRQDFRELELPGLPFDACICLFDSLNYLLELADLQRAFQRVAAHLKPGGCFIFDMNAIRALEMGMFDQTGTGRDASLEYEWRSAWEPRSRLCTISMEFRHYQAGGLRVLHETHVQRGYTLREITRSLELAGFEVLAVYDAFTTRPPGPKSDRYHAIARFG